MRPLLLVLLLTACARVPTLDARIPESERRAPPPALVPLGGLLAAADAAPAVPPTDDLTARAAALSDRAPVIPVSGAPASGDLAPRLDDLAARAAALRDAGLSDDDRTRLGASLP